MTSRSCRLPWLLVFFIAIAHALEVTPNSPCASFCLNNIQDNPSNGGASYTIAKDTVCDDWEFEGPNSTVRGRKWKDCLSCQQNSTAIDRKSNENEVYWFLFNMKFTLDWCVFGYPDNPDIIPANQKCAETCAGENNSAKLSLTDRLLQTNATLQYLYCNGPGIKSTLDDCAACLAKVPYAQALGHYAEALGTACVQKPDLGQTVKIDFDLFPPPVTPTLSASLAPAPRTQTETVTLTSNPPYPPPTPAAISASAVSAVVASSSAAAAASQASHDKNVRVGVGVGLGAGGALAILAVACLVLVRRRSAKNKKLSEEEMRQRWESGYPANPDQKQSGIASHPRSELPDGVDGSVVEADDGRPTEIAMLDSHTARGSPGGFSSSGAGTAGFGSSGGGNSSWNSSPRGSRASRSAISRLLGTKPAVPAKD